MLLRDFLSMGARVCFAVFALKRILCSGVCTSLYSVLRLYGCDDFSVDLPIAVRGHPDLACTM